MDRDPDLAAPPDRRSTLGLQAQGGVLHYGPNWVPSILTWHELAEHGLHVHGPGLENRRIVRDEEMLRDWCLASIERQWAIAAGGSSLSNFAFSANSRDATTCPSLATILAENPMSADMPGSPLIWKLLTSTTSW